MNHYPLTLSKIFEAFDILDRTRGETRVLPKHYTEEPVWSEDETSYKMKMVAPGMSIEDIEIEIQDSVLTLSTFYSEEIKKEDEKEGEEVKRQEKSIHRWKMPKDIDNKKISATLSKGILEIQINKLPKPKAVKIEITEIK